MSKIAYELSVASSIKDVLQKLHIELQTGIMITKVTEDAQYVLAKNGIDLPEMYKDSMPLSLSICQHTAAMDFPLVISNTITHPLLRESRAFAELNIVAYMGAPIHFDEVYAPTGAICAVNHRERHWNEDEIATILMAAQACDRIYQQNTTT
jgi:GAF domain-containing protein